MEEIDDTGTPEQHLHASRGIEVSMGQLVVREKISRIWQKNVDARFSVPFIRKLRLARIDRLYAIDDRYDSEYHIVLKDQADCGLIPKQPEISDPEQT